MLGYVWLTCARFKYPLVWCALGKHEPIERRYSRRRSAFDFPFCPFGGGRGSIGVVALEEVLDRGGGASEGRKEEAMGVGAGVDARE